MFVEGNSRLKRIKYGLTRAVLNISRIVSEAAPGDPASLHNHISEIMNAPMEYRSTITPKLVDASQFNAEPALAQACEIILGKTKIKLKDLLEQSNAYILDNGFKCTVSYINGQLEIHSDDVVNVTLKNDFIAKKVTINTKGNVKIDTGESTIILDKGISVNAYKIDINSEIITPSKVLLRANLDKSKNTFKHSYVKIKKTYLCSHN